MAPWKSYCDCGDTWTITCGGITPNGTGTPVIDWDQVTCKSAPGTATTITNENGAYILHGQPYEVHLKS